MKKKPLLIAILSVIIPALLSCNRHNHSGVTIPIAPDRLDSPSIHQFFSKIEVVPLENNIDVLIKRIDKIIYYRKTYFILDISSSTVFLFDDNGKYLRKIQQTSNFGIGLFENIRDFEINRFNNTIELLSPRGRIFVYSIEGKQQLRTISIPEIRAVQYLRDLTKDTIVLYSIFESKRISYYSRSKNKIMKSAFEIPVFISRQTPLNNLNSPFFEFNNQVYLTTAFSRSVYTLDGDEMNVKYTWDFGKYNLNIDSLLSDKPWQYYSNFFRKKDLVANIFYNVETPKYVFVKFLFRRHRENLIFDKVTHQYHVFNEFKEKVDFPLSLFSYNQGVYTSAEPNHISEVVSQNLLDEKNREILKGIKPTDNPVIVKYHFK